MFQSSTLKKAVGFPGIFIPFKHLVSLTGQKVVLPFYHSVSDQHQPHINHIYRPRSIQKFSDDIEFLCKHYKPVSIEELHKKIISGKNNKNLFHITFDDGLSEFYHVAAPILEQKGIPATVFLNSDFIDNKDLFYRYKVSLIIETLNKGFNVNSVNKLLNLPKNSTQVHIAKRLLSFTHLQSETIHLILNNMSIDVPKYLKEQQPYMNQDQIKNLINKGFTIGAHSVNHPHFKNISHTEQKFQVTQCFQVLEKQFDVKCRYFSFPFSDENVSRSFFDWLYTEAQCKLSFGISGLKRDISPFHLHRIAMENSFETTKHLIKNEYFYYLIKAFFNKNKISRE